MATSADANRALESPLELMYRSGRVTIPNIATDVSTIANALDSVKCTLDVQAAHAGEPPVIVDALTVCWDVHNALRRMVSSMNNAAAAVIASADDFRRTDNDAAQDFRRMDPSLRRGDPGEAPEVAPSTNPESPGATDYSDYDDAAPTKGDGEYVEPTPAPEINCETGTDDDIAPVEIPEEVSR